MTTSQQPPQGDHQNQQPQIPQQWGPPPSYPQEKTYAQPMYAPRNGLGITALCLGIVGILFGLVPFTGFIAFGLGAIGVILGLVGFSRARKRVATNPKMAVAGIVLSVGALALGVWGMVIVFTGLNQLSQDLSQPYTSTPPPAASPAVTNADSESPSAAPSYQLKVEGTAKAAMISWSANGSSGSVDSVKVPWAKTITGEQGSSFQSFTVSAFTPYGDSGDLTCTIVDTKSGEVVSTKSAANGGGDSGSAMVSCDVMG